MSRKGPAYGHAIEVIKQYPDNLRMYEPYQQRREDIINGTAPVPEVRISGKGRPGNPTESKGIALASEAAIKHLEEATLAVKYAIDDYGGDETNEVNRAMLTIVRLLYWDRTHTIVGAARAVGYTERHARRLRWTFVRRVMEYLGW
jgi:hypothetical protein